MNRSLILFPVCISLLAAGSLLILPAATPLAARGGNEIPLSAARIYFEYNSSGNDLGVHVFLDGEDWKRMRIEDPSGEEIFHVRGRGPYAGLGMTELFFEGAEPTLTDVPLRELLEMFPEGDYDFSGVTVDHQELEGTGTLTHAIPAGPAVWATFVAPDRLTIAWNPVVAPPPGFPAVPITIQGYQVLVGAFHVTVPSGTTSVTVTPEFVAALPAGVQPFEVLAIEVGGNQSITESSFVK